MERKTLGEMIASLRKQNGMTQLDLAQKMGVTDKAVSKWERDLSCPDVATLPKLAEIFGISVDELIRMRPDTPRPETSQRKLPAIGLVLRAITLAMGVAVTALSLLGQIDATSGLTLLGIGLSCAGIALLEKPKNP